MWGQEQPAYLCQPSRPGSNPVCLQAAYLQKLGISTVVFERRHVIGGAAVTEEIIPGEPQEIVEGAGGGGGTLDECGDFTGLFQGSSSPELPTCSACCDLGSTRTWS